MRRRTRRSTIAYATWNGEELTVEFEATPSESDYGVPGSPTFTEYTDIMIRSLTILDIEVDPDILPAELQEALRALSDEVDWEEEEPDYSDIEGDH